MTEWPELPLSEWRDTYNFLEDALEIRVDDGEVMSVALAPRTVADVYADIMARLHSVGMPVCSQYGAELKPAVR